MDVLAITPMPEMTSALLWFWAVIATSVAVIGAAQMINAVLDQQPRQFFFGLLMFTVSGTVAIIASFQA